MVEARVRTQNVRLTSRDLKVLRALFDNTVMSFDQIRESLFAGLSAVTAYNRVNDLVKAGLVESLRVGSVVYQSEPKLIGNIYRVSRLGIAELKTAFGLDEIERPDPFPWNTMQLSHDLMLNDVTKVFQSNGFGYQVVNGKHLNDEPGADERVPDAILAKPGSKEQVALELELTVKSERRYREIILSYRLSQKFSRICYISNDRGLLRKVQSLVTGYPLKKHEYEQRIGKFYFVTLAELADPATREKVFGHLLNRALGKEVSL